ncbi:hypothetical protein JANAI62_25320 [Jannaschia pagri]|uniref:Uncharacterized protein n=1 Tax=Jannaschia pagri TaxID=2829797 RepID=A0ABQ4NNW1_9RHOB|nr:hypothetical protein JANAI61_25320 [Jannaschia sp. AI_61]GIT95909.1 hypothetical protein JANAI62_25320 [Jannaschia sp. AI_62]
MQPARWRKDGLWHKRTHSKSERKQAGQSQHRKRYRRSNGIVEVPEPFYDVPRPLRALKGIDNANGAQQGVVDFTEAFTFEGVHHTQPHIDLGVMRPSHSGETVTRQR